MTSIVFMLQINRYNVIFCKADTMPPPFSLSFNIAACCAVSTRINGEQWPQWACGKLNAADLPDVKPELAFMPPMQRRRLSLPARLFFQAANEVLPHGEHCPSVFMSHDGEMARSFDLWLGLLRDNEVSPTSFGLSVHNALAGQFSMWRNDMSEYTALSARCDGLETAVAEASALLAEGAPRVLAVCVDEPLPEHFTVTPIQRPPFAYALALLLENGSNWTLAMQPENTIQSENTEYSPIDWLRHYHRGDTAWTRNAQNKVWQWRRG